MASPTDKSESDSTNKSKTVTSTLSRNYSSAKEIKSVVPRERYMNLPIIIEKKEKIQNPKKN